MNWSRHTKYALVSECRRFTIAKVIVQAGVRYELWRDGAFIDAYPSADAAKAATEDLAKEVA